jgi:predicted transposase YdaD
MSYDNVCKLLAEKYPFDFARWLLPEEPKTIKVLKTELSIKPIRADFVTFLQTVFVGCVRQSRNAPST